MIDYVIVGSGLTGATIARILRDAGREVLVIERREHLGGNVHDFVHPSGIRIHTYGPHYFRTASDRIWSFVNRFATFYKYEAIIKSYVEGQYENWPIAGSYIRQTVGHDWKASRNAYPKSFEDACLAMMPRIIYERFVKGYTEKQWGVPASTLSANLANRFDIREDDDPRLCRHPHQGIPVDGYESFMRNILSGIPLMLNVDYLKVKGSFQARKNLIYTGPIDEFFGYDLGQLRYRGQVRDHRYISETDYKQPCAQVNNPDPDNGLHIRTVEWKHIMPKDYAARIRGTVVTRETTITPRHSNHYEYPFPDSKNVILYDKYYERAQCIPNLIVCGRLGHYRYYDMDQAIDKAMAIADRILKEG